jgi:hypothetical protein
MRGTLKGALAMLVLLLLALLCWQLLDQLRETQKIQRQATIDHTADQAAQVSLNMALNAQIALNLLPIVEQPQSTDELQDLLRKLQKSLPELSSLALLSPSGRILSDTAGTSDDADYLGELVRRSRAQPHYYSNAIDGSRVYLLLHQASGSNRGYWTLRFRPTFFTSLTHLNETGTAPLWLVENRFNHQPRRGIAAGQPRHLDPGRCGQQRTDRRAEQQRLATTWTVRSPASARRTATGFHWQMPAMPGFFHAAVHRPAEHAPSAAPAARRSPTLPGNFRRLGRGIVRTRHVWPAQRV